MGTLHTGGPRVVQQTKLGNFDRTVKSPSTVVYPNMSEQATKVFKDAASSQVPNTDKQHSMEDSSEPIADKKPQGITARIQKASQTK